MFIKSKKNLVSHGPKWRLFYKTVTFLFGLQIVIDIDWLTDYWIFITLRTTATTKAASTTVQQTVYLVNQSLSFQYLYFNVLNNNNPYLWKQQKYKKKLMLIFIVLLLICRFIYTFSICLIDRWCNRNKHISKHTSTQ